MNNSIRRRRGRQSFRKVAVSVPARLLDAVEEQVRSRNADSVSAFVSDAVEEKLERDLLPEALDEAWRDKPITKREKQWADRILRA
jgi:hypothetical protein